MNRVAIALGSNLGDRRGNLLWAADQLRAHITGGVLSDFIETDPVGVPDAQPLYLNAAFAGLTDLTPSATLDWLLSLEHARGRTRPGYRAARTLDLDLILHGDAVLETPTLVLPHPRFRERGFVLQPLAEIAAEWIDPVTQKSVARLLAEQQSSASDNDVRVAR